VSLNKQNSMVRPTFGVPGEHFEEFNSAEVSSGRSSSAGEVTRTALRLLEAEAMKKKVLHKALAEGKRSGFEKGFDPNAHLKKLHNKFL
jgi:antitoxin ParD1/3/4